MRHIPVPTEANTSIIVTLPSGITCLVAAGQAYEEINEELEPTGMKL